MAAREKDADSFFFFFFFYALPTALTWVKKGNRDRSREEEAKKNDIFAIRVGDMRRLFSSLMIEIFRSIRGKLIIRHVTSLYVN